MNDAEHLLQFRTAPPQPDFSHKTPLEFFLMYFDDELVDAIITESNRYAQQHNFTLLMTSSELMTFIGTLLLSGYCKLPHRRMYWNDADDVPKLVAKSIRRNRFEEILTNFHLADNNNLDVSDRLAKLRPFVSKLQDKFRENNTLDEFISIDESMIPYYGRHYSKQYIKGKPIRFGFKNWALCSSTGYMYAFDIYTGKSGTTYEYGLGGHVVVGLIEQACIPSQSGHKIVFDNYFTSYGLLSHLRAIGYAGIGTIRENRTGKCTCKSVAVIKKEVRGSYDYRSSGQVLIIRWKDNSVVTLGSNFGEMEEGHVMRWSQTEKKKVSITRPTLFNVYNSGMGGVDQIDQQIAAYRTRIRQRKWWWPIAAYLIDATVVNAWYLSRKFGGNTASLLEFRREIASTLLKSFGMPSLQGRRPSAVNDDVRTDNKNHWIVKGDTDRRCKLCGKKSIYRCGKCDVGLHADCFKLYHIR